MQGKLLARLGEPAAGRGSSGAARHRRGFSRGDLYVGEVSFTAYPRYHDGKAPPPEGVRCLQKYRRVPA